MRALHGWTRSVFVRNTYSPSIFSAKKHQHRYANLHQTLKSAPKKNALSGIFQITRQLSTKPITSSESYVLVLITDPLT